MVAWSGLLTVVRDEAPFCCRPTRKSRKVMKREKMEDFIFTTSDRKSNVKSILFSAVSSVGLAALAGSSMGTAAAVAACVPIIVPVSNALIDAGIPIGDEAKKSMYSLTTVNYLQLSFGLIEFLSGDIVNGFTNMVMAGVGFYVVSLDGIVLLPSYSITSTVFAGVSAVDLLQMILQKGVITGDLPLSENLMKLATIAHPLLYAASAFIAWNLIEQLRSGLLRNATGIQTDIPTASTASSMIFEPSVPVGSRRPFVGRAFRVREETSPSINDT